ncbi:MAG: 30S ribosomal protein S12 methylthiotransferase RimO, partial [Candidatus Sumerlaeia bacterium]|nr:30S ribosomal protein S12 methylthiotransferase RimO [Candidatus Sumerlaeia bacterium]
VITTCGFLLSAKKQSLEHIDQWVQVRKKHGTRLGVIGCLAQRSREELLRDYPEIDFLAGVGEFERVAQLVVGERKSAFLSPTNAEKEPWSLEQQSASALLSPSGELQPSVIEFDDRSFSQDAPRIVLTQTLPRRRIEQRPHGFLKISDGCNHTCTFCSIPLMKGVYSSVPKNILLDEARRLLDDGVRELNIVAQDITKYGLDLEKRFMLPELLESICNLEGEFWIRLFYLYPSTVTKDLVALMKDQPKIVRYLDIPLQHLDQDVLRRMKRPHDRARTMDMLRMIREELPGVTLRTTFIVGFPGETPDEFKTLTDAVKEIRFERLGVFTYSREAGTPAADLPNQVTETVKLRRKDKLMKLQSKLSAEWAAEQVGQTRRVLVEGSIPDSNWFVARSHSEAADIDGVVRLYSERPLKSGDFVTVKLTNATTYDFDAVVVE